MSEGFFDLHSLCRDKSHWIEILSHRIENEKRAAQHKSSCPKHSCSWHSCINIALQMLNNRWNWVWLSDDCRPRTGRKSVGIAETQTKKIFQQFFAAHTFFSVSILCFLLIVFLFFRHGICALYHFRYGFHRSSITFLSAPIIPLNVCLKTQRKRRPFLSLSLSVCVSAKSVIHTEPFRINMRFYRDLEDQTQKTHNAHNNNKVSSNRALLAIYVSAPSGSRFFSLFLLHSVVFVYYYCFLWPNTAAYMRECSVFAFSQTCDYTIFDFISSAALRDRSTKLTFLFT